MRQLPRTPPFTKICFFVNIIAFHLIMFGTLTLYMLKTEKIRPPAPPKRHFPMTVKVHVGMFRSCRNFVLHTPMGSLEVEDHCTSNDAPRWQKTAAGLGAVSVLLALNGLLLGLAEMSIWKISNVLMAKLIVTASSALTACFIIPPIVIYATNRDDYKGLACNLHFSFVVTCVALGMYIFHTSLSLFGAIYYRNFEFNTEDQLLGGKNANGQVVIYYT